MQPVPEIEHVSHMFICWAAREGISLSDYIKKQLERVAEQPTVREWLERTQEAKPIPTRRTAAQVIRDLREKR